ncbi:MAG TPA: GGDEF domain-containing protein [Thermodesulfobacteriota bacterium]|nr:GGDEF domain-containing protein [Thermodesulfobacteriota bacterium]
MVKEQGTGTTVVKKGVRAPIAPGQSCLIVFYGQNLGKRYFLDSDEQLIGRVDLAQIHLNQESVSRKHARIVKAKDGCCYVKDLGSTNGTFVNDQQVAEAELHNGDMLRIGQTIFKYLTGNNIEIQYHEEFFRLTAIDGLTQAYSKRFLLETLDREFHRAIRHSRQLSLIMLDIDRFKLINDTHGHLAGDSVLRELSGIILGHIRREDVFARYGGEEFVLVLPETDFKHAVRISEKLRQLIAGYSFYFRGKGIPVTVSLGVAAVGGPGEAESVQDFIALADAKLYEAKQSGRNRVAY